ncbi:hypothetical protein JKF63_03276 [Porcisia hertigi]|uniref:Uncharacterized protein n=1 Tax=Porcisia hertigi TaxID=2761500 RepID=A0A836IS06_9TRYP|nr:hypothetical protein JKF63_03276 [Porcisia hertigi]
MTTSASSVTIQREDSSANLRPGASSVNACRGRAHRKKSPPASCDQLLYLRALYPYASYDDLQAVVENTDGIDEAAKRAYEALNPDYTGFTYLKDQHDLLFNAKLPRAERETAFAGLKESLGERAAEAFRPGNFGNLSQLQEYHDTVGLFIVNTSDWDRAMLLPSRDLAEVAFMDLSLRGETTEYVASPATMVGDSDNRRERTQGDGLPTRRVPLATMKSATGGTAGLRLSIQSEAPTNVAFLAQSCRSSEEPPRTGQHSGDEEVDTPGVIYLRKNDAPCAAPIISWAPEAMYVGPAGAQWVRKETLRAFDEAAFKDPQRRSAKPPLLEDGAVTDVEASLLDCNIAASSAVAYNVYEPAARGRGGGQPGSTAASPLLPKYHPLFIKGENRTHEPFEVCDTSHVNSGGGHDDASTKVISTAEEPHTLHSHSSRHRGVLRGHVNANGRADDGAISETQNKRNPRIDVAREALHTGRRSPFTTSEAVGPRMRTPTSVDNFFYEIIMHTPVASPRLERDNDTRLSVPVPMGSPALDDASLFHIGAGDSQQHEAMRDGWERRVHTNGSHTAGSDAREVHYVRSFPAGPVAIPAAHSGCSSLDPAAFLDAEMARWDTALKMLAPYEVVFGSKYRCEIVRCIHDHCPKLRANSTLILQRLLHVVGIALRNKELVEGMTEELLEVPFFGSILLSTSPVKVSQLSFREDRCSIEFCEEGTRLKVKLNLKAVVLEAIQFAYIGEGSAARQERKARLSQRGMWAPSSRSASSVSRSCQRNQYAEGVTRGTARIKAADVDVKGVVYASLMASGKVHVRFTKVTVSLGSFRLSTNVTKLNILCTLGAPILRLMVQHGMEKALRSVQSL